MPIHLLRHCHPLGQAPDAGLSTRGEEQATALVAALAHLPITALVSSPWTRAVRSIAPLAEARGLAVHTDARLTEYILAPEPRDDWRVELARNYAEPHRALPGGESVAEAAARLRAVLAGCADGALVVSHGGLLSALVEVSRPGSGFAFWERLRTPALLRVDHDAVTEIELGL